MKPGDKVTIEATVLSVGCVDNSDEQFANLQLPNGQTLSNISSNDVLVTEPEAKIEKPKASDVFSSDVKATDIQKEKEGEPRIGGDLFW